MPGSFTSTFPVTPGSVISTLSLLGLSGQPHQLLDTLAQHRRFWGQVGSCFCTQGFPAACMKESGHSNQTLCSWQSFSVVLAPAFTKRPGLTVPVLGLVRHSTHRSIHVPTHQALL